MKIKDPLLNEGKDSKKEDKKETPKVEKEIVKPVTPGNVDRQLLSDKERVKRALAKQPQVSFIIPPGESPSIPEEVTINGYKTVIKKGVRVEIPEQIAEMLANKYNVELSAGKESLISRDSKIEKALN